MRFFGKGHLFMLHHKGKHRFYWLLRGHTYEKPTRSSALALK